MLLATLLTSFFLNALLSGMPNGEYSNLAFSNTLGLCPKSSPVRYSYLSKGSLYDSAEVLATSLLKSYWAWFALILLSQGF